MRLWCTALATGSIKSRPLESTSSRWNAAPRGQARGQYKRAVTSSQAAAGALGRCRRLKPCSDSCMCKVLNLIFIMIWGDRTMGDMSKPCIQESKQGSGHRRLPWPPYSGSAETRKSFLHGHAVVMHIARAPLGPSSFHAELARRPHANHCCGPLVWPTAG